MRRLMLLALTLPFLTPVLAEPVKYQLDAGHSFVYFSYDHFGYSTQQSRFNSVLGNITLDMAAQTGQVEVTINTQSVDTGNDLFNQHIQAADFLNTAKFPIATFKSSKINFVDNQPASIDGTLTIKGIRKPVTFTLSSFLLKPHPLSKKEVIGANASTVIKRTDFRAGKYAPNVSDEVTLKIAVEAIKQ